MAFSRLPVLPVDALYNKIMPAHRRPVLFPSLRRFEGSLLQDSGESFYP